jgi:hypothetical protein
MDRPELKLEALYFWVHNKKDGPLMIWDGLSLEFREHVHGAFDGSFAANCLQYLNEPISAWALFKKVKDIAHDDFMHNTQQPIYKTHWESQFKTDEVNAKKLAMYNLSGDGRKRALVDYVKSIALTDI